MSGYDPRHWQAVYITRFVRCDRVSVIEDPLFVHPWHVIGTSMTFYRVIEALTWVDEQIPLECHCTDQELLSAEIDMAKKEIP